MDQIVAIYWVDQKISKFVLLGVQKIVNLKEIPFASHLIGEGNGTPLQYSCLENPMDGGAW